MILITGATGYIGRHLVSRLVDQGPRCLVRNTSRAASILPADKVELVEGDTTQPASLEAAVRGVDTIVHAAFITADQKQSAGNSYEKTNVQGTSNLIKAAKNAGVKRIIEIGGLGTTIIQPSVLFGKNAPFIKGLSGLISSAPVVPLIGGGKVLFQPIYVEDVVTVIVKTLEDPARTTGKTFTIGGPAYYSFTQVIDELLRAMHKTRIKSPAPTVLVGIGAAVMEAVLPKPPLTRAAMTLFSFNNTTDLNSVERDFGFRPVSFTTYLQEHGV